MYEIISDSGLYTIPYSFYISFMSVLILCRIHPRHRVNGKVRSYENILDSFESDIVQTKSEH